jgi:hypothetical protein
MALATATIIALGGAAIGAGMNLTQAAAARDRQQEADREAGKLMAEAKKKLETDFYEGLKIPMDAYENAQEANIQAQQQSIEALQQADSRSLAAGVGKVAMASNENTETIRAQQAQEMFELEKMKAGNKDDMNQQLAQMDVAGAQDQAARAAQADEQVGMLQAGAVNAVTAGITSAAESQSLYKKQGLSGADARRMKANMKGVNTTGLGGQLGTIQKTDLSGILNPKKGNDISSLMPQKSAFSPKMDFGFNFLPRLKDFGVNNPLPIPTYNTTD